MEVFRQLLFNMVGFQPLYIVAVAVCPADYAFECNRTMAPEFHTAWVYRPNLEACQAYGLSILEGAEFDDVEQQARIYCVLAETFSDAVHFNVVPKN